MDRTTLPVAVIGAGPVGLAAAAHLLQAGLTPMVLEAGDAVGASVRRWAHVRVFSPWRSNIDRVAAGLLADAAWARPSDDDFPTGQELVERYLEPLAELPLLAPRLRLNTRVVAVTRQGMDKMKSAGREEAPFLLRLRQPDGSDAELLARAVIDASGTYATPSPLGGDGLPARGERDLAERIHYGMPDVLGRDRGRYAGRRVLVVGSGHSAFNTLLDLVELARDASETTVLWAMRREITPQLYGGGENDALPARGSLGERLRRAVQRGEIALFTGFKTAAVVHTGEGIVVSSANADLPPVDEIVAVTGFRPDLSPLAELRLELDPAVESPRALAPLIDPNIHSCGTVRPHGAEELKHPETDFYLVGMKSYGRAPTFLMLTGYEQVRSVVAALQGDWERARAVELELPETGVCTLDSAEAPEPAGCCVAPEEAASGCCTPLPAGAGACCVESRALQLAEVSAAGNAAGSCCG
ncbi:MAG TPA: FAD-dependent oxidoreductase [Thermomicrobiaceae bacterium]|nr:FAD-dependent oxidoreductase [Thermomicrobiaceae bacterium]